MISTSLRALLLAALALIMASCGTPKSTGAKGRRVVRMPPQTGSYLPRVVEVSGTTRKDREESRAAKKKAKKKRPPKEDENYAPRGGFR